MFDLNVGADLFPTVFFASGGVAVGVAGLYGRAKLALGLALSFLIGGIATGLTQQGPGYWLPPVVLGGGYLLLTLACRFQVQVKTFLALRRAHAALILLGGPLLSIAWVAYLLQSSDGQIDAAPTPVPPLVPSGFVARTDRGRMIPLLRQPAAMVPPSVSRELDHALVDRFHFRLIQTAPADTRSDCHGWVFAGGRYHLVGGEVDKILEDNGYTEVSQPQANDVIVYRGRSGEVRHSGVVRAVNGDLILVESKWGATGQYLHAPAAQVYSDRWTFYRSPRRGHELPIVAGP